jgi:alanyl-tRNA synthetase
MGEALQGMETIGDVRLVVRQIEASNPGDMRAAADHLRGELGSGVAILGADTGGKASFLVLVTPDLVAAGRFKADEIVRQVAQVAGGSGGGKPDLALAGAKDASRIADALAHGRQIVRDALRGDRTFG